jgi:hypothetical protein
MKQELCSYISALTLTVVVSLAVFTAGCATITTGRAEDASFAAFPSAESWAEATSGPLDFGRGPVSALAGREGNESDPIKLDSAKSEKVQ